MPATLASVEVRRGRALVDERQVDQLVVGVDVAQEAAEAVPLVEVGVGAQLHSAALEQLDERGACLTRMALALLQLGSVDLQQAHALAIRRPERVAVGDRFDANALRAR